MWGLRPCNPGPPALLQPGRKVGPGAERRGSKKAVRFRGTALRTEARLPPCEAFPAFFLLKQKEPAGVPTCGGLGTGLSELVNIESAAARTAKPAIVVKFVPRIRIQRENIRELFLSFIGKTGFPEITSCDLHGDHSW